MFSDSVRAAGTVALSLFILSLSACSVKEERQECPCFLTVDFSSVDAAALKGKGLETLEVLIVGKDGFSDYQAWRLDERIEEYCVPVPRAGTDVTVVCKNGGQCVAGEGIVFDEGVECPVIQMFSESLVPGGDEDRLNVELHKNYCEMTVRIKTSYGIRERPFKVKVDGNVCGYSPDGTPREGTLCYCSGPSLEGLCTVRVPRQMDDSLWIELHFLDSGEIRTFPIGEYIAESGYDWEAPDLEDISVEMDFSRTGAELSIMKWRKTLSFDMTF